MSNSGRARTRPGFNQRDIPPSRDSDEPTVRQKSRSPSRGQSVPRADPFAVVAKIRTKRGSDELDRGERVKPTSSMVTSSSKMSITTSASRRPPSAVSIQQMKRRENSARPSEAPDTIKGPDLRSMSALEVELRKEIEALKKSVSESKKLARRQNKQIEELRAELNATRLGKQDNEAQLQSLQSKTKATDELLATIESQCQCQICMELLVRPYALAPCGHILCVSCLQEWFRKAPPSASDDDMDIDPNDDAEYLMHRHKSCPCCRAVILRRPIPVFTVKSISSTLSKAKASALDGPRGSPLIHRSASPPLDDDPWKGLFPDSGSEQDQEEGEQYYDIWEDDDEGLDQAYSDEEMSDEDAFAATAQLMFYGDPADIYISSGEEGEQYEESSDEEEAPRYCHPQWEPPSFTISAGAMNRLPAGHASMVRRGCTEAMINAFGMRYSHSQGLIAHVPSFDWRQDWDVSSTMSRNRRRRSNRLFLGWNIERHRRDENGEEFMKSTLVDLENNDEQWEVTERAPGLFDAVKLVNELELEPYDTTDSEVYVS